MVTESLRVEPCQASDIMSPGWCRRLKKGWAFEITFDPDDWGNAGVEEFKGWCKERGIRIFEDFGWGLSRVITGHIPDDTTAVEFKLRWS